jgi:hypothetical protein
MKPIAKQLLVPVAFAAALWLSLSDFFSPWGSGFKNFLGANFHVAAHSYSRHGFLELKLAPYYEPFSLTHGQGLYLHRPALPYVLSGLSFQAFGAAETSIRLPAVLACFLGLFLFYRLVRRFFDEDLARMSLLLALIVPANIYYGSMPGWNVYGILFWLASAWLYLEYRADRSWRRLFWLGAAGCLGVWFDLSLLYLVPFVFLLDLRSARRLDIRLLAVLCAIAAQLVLFGLYNFWISGEAFDISYAQSLLTVRNNHPEFTWLLWLQNQIRFASYFFTWPLLIAAALGVIARLTRASALSGTQLDMLLLLIGFGMLDLVVYFFHSYKEDFSNVLLYPGLTLLAGMGLTWLWRYDSVRGWPLARVAAVGLGMGAVLIGLHHSRQLFAARSQSVFRDVANATIQVTPDDALLLLSPDTPMMSLAYLAEREGVYLIQDEWLSLEQLSEVGIDQTVHYLAYTPRQSEPLLALLESSHTWSFGDAALYQVQAGAPSP